MTHGHRRPLLTVISLLVVLSLGIVACDPSPGGSSPPATTAAPSAVPASPSSAASPPTSPTAAPSTSAADACPIAPQTGRLPSDRLVAIAVTETDTADVVTFQFGNDSLPGPAGAPEGTLETAQPPFIQGGSGEPQEVIGQHVALVRFAGMSLANDVGQPVYQGEPEFRPDLSALRHVVNMEMFEGVVSWYIGYDGTGCVTLTSDGRNVSVAIEHPAS